MTHGPCMVERARGGPRRRALARERGARAGLAAAGRRDGRRRAAREVALGAARALLERLGDLDAHADRQAEIGEALLQIARVERFQKLELEFLKRKQN